MTLNYLKNKQKNSFSKIPSDLATEEMFDGALGKYTGSYYTIELNKDLKPYHAKIVTVPKIHEPTMKKEVYRFILRSIYLRKLLIPNRQLLLLLCLR